MPRQPGRPRQRRYDRFAILDYVDTYQYTHNNRSPSQRQIRAALEISASSVVHNMVHRLARAGLLTITTFGRGLGAELEITDIGREELQRWRDSRQSEIAPDTSTPQAPQ